MIHLRHNLAMRAMSDILNISFKSISNIIDDEQSLSEFTVEHLSFPSHDKLAMDLTITYCRLLVHMQENLELQV